MHVKNRRKAMVTLTKYLVPATDPGRFDLKLFSTTVTKIVPGTMRATATPDQPKSHQARGRSARR